MTVTEESRHRLHQALDRTIGQEEATTLMEHLPPVGWADVATKQDLAHLREHIDARFATERAHTDHRFATIDHRFETIDHRFDEVDRRFDEVGRRFETEHAQLGQTLDLRFGELGTRFEELDKRLALMTEMWAATNQRLVAIETRLTQQLWQFVTLNAAFGAMLVGVLRFT